MRTADIARFSLTSARRVSVFNPSHLQGGGQGFDSPVSTRANGP